MSESLQPGAAPEPSRQRRWPRVLLILSLALNLLFIGLVGGAVWARKNGIFGGPRHLAFIGAIRRAVKDMPEERRKVAEEILSRHRARIRPLRRQVHRGRQAVLETLTGDTFDEAAFRRSLDRMQSSETEMRSAMAEFAVELMGRMTAEERRLFVKRVMRRRFRRHGPGGGGARWHPREGP